MNNLQSLKLKLKSEKKKLLEISHSHTTTGTKKVNESNKTSKNNGKKSCDSLFFRAYVVNTHL